MSVQAAVAAKEAFQRIAAGSAPAGMRVAGLLDFSKEPLPKGAKLPPDLTVEAINLSNQTALTSLPARLTAYELVAANCPWRELPDDLRVECRLDLSDCHELERLPPGLTVGALTLRGCTSLVALPEDLDVWFLTLTGCWAFERWPERANVRGGRLLLRGCTALRSLPSTLGRLSALSVRDCPNLTSLPEGIEISGWLDIAHSGIKSEASLPASLNGVQLRWAGVDVDRRIAFHPETMTVQEVLQEGNVERRRVLLDRYGYSRFVRDADARVLDEDRDAGGPRQLLRVFIPRDEDLVALSCFCPSTGRQYVIRVPQQMSTCHQAAAWIAGFDNPNDYQPIVET